jgi:hypothetical protein
LLRQMLQLTLQQRSDQTLQQWAFSTTCCADNMGDFCWLLSLPKTGY